MPSWFEGQPGSILLATGLLAGFMLLAGCAVQQGVYHQVRPGQTAWAIAQAYDVDVAVLLRVNDIQDPSQLTPGQRLLIPGVSEQRTVSASDNDSSGSESDSPSPDPPNETSSSNGFDPVWPCQGEIVESFGASDGDPARQGIRIRPDGPGDVLAVEAGHVQFAGQVDRIESLGNIVILRHPNQFYSVYAHLDGLDVEAEQEVSRGQALGPIGSTGFVSEPTCYLEIRQEREPRDPTSYLGETP